VDRNGRKIDEVMVAVYRAPKSFTGEESVEIIGHGGTATVLAVYRELLAAGFRPAERGEFTFRSFANGKNDLARAEAVREIIEAKTGEARARATGRLSGALSDEVEAIKNLVVTALAAIEVEIEYPEDEETTKGAFDSARIDEAMRRLAELESSWAAERLYRDGARVVLAGRTNAGKSSLFNALLKEDRAIVSDIHGTTRDWLEAMADFSGIPVRLFDTAGLRKTDDEIEAEGVERSRAIAAEADLALYLVDATVGLAPDDEAFLLDPDKALPPVLLVWNKSDKDGARQLPQIDALPESVRARCAISAKRGTGIADCVSVATDLLLGDAERTPREASIGTERQKTAVRAALESLRHAKESTSAGFPMDAIAQDLEDALAPLGEITGEVTSSEILDAVFSGFCVGK
jgi:tRNA modification GTPase